MLCHSPNYLWVILVPTLSLTGLQCPAWKGGLCLSEYVLQPLRGPKREPRKNTKMSARLGDDSSMGDRAREIFRVESHPERTGTRMSDKTAQEYSRALLTVANMDQPQFCATTITTNALGKTGRKCNKICLSCEIEDLRVHLPVFSNFSIRSGFLNFVVISKFSPTFYYEQFQTYNKFEMASQ